MCFATNLSVVVCLFVCSIHSSTLKSFGFHRQASCAPVQFRRRRNRSERGLIEQSSSCNFDLSKKNASSSIEDLEINNPLKCSLDSSYVFHLNSWNLHKLIIDLMLEMCLRIRSLNLQLPTISC